MYSDANVIDITKSAIIFCGWIFVIRIRSMVLSFRNDVEDAFDKIITIIVIRKT